MNSHHQNHNGIKKGSSTTTANVGIGNGGSGNTILESSNLINSINNSTATSTSHDTFELPDDISEDDECLLTNILSAIYAGDLCSSYKVDTIPNVGYLIKCSLINEDNFEIGIDDLQFITCANPVRIERIAICRCAGGKTELVVKVLNTKQRVMVTTSCSFMATKKRKFTQISSSSSSA